MLSSRAGQKGCGAARQERRRVEREKNGRGASQTRRRGGRHAHTQKSEKGKDKGITRREETTWGRAFLTWPAPPPHPALLLSLFACPMQGHQSRASGLWVEPPNPRGFSCSPKFCIATGEAAIGGSANGPGVIGCVSHQHPYFSFLFPKMCRGWCHSHWHPPAKPRPGPT